MKIGIGRSLPGWMMASIARARTRILPVGLACAVALPPLMLIPGGYSSFGPPKLVAFSLSVLLIAVGVLADDHAAKRLIETLKHSRIAWCGSALAGIAVLSTLTAVESRQAILGSHPDFRGLVLILGAGVIGAGAVATGARRDAFVFIARTTVIVAGFIGLLALREGLLAIPGLHSWQLLRITSTLGNSSNLGVYAVMALPLAAWTALQQEPRRWRYAGAITTAVLLIVLVWTSSRGAWVGAAAGLAAFAACGVLSREGISAVRGRKWLLAGGVVALGAAALSSPMLGTRILSLFDMQSKTWTWRLSAWRSSVEMVVDRPFLGWGPNSFRFAYPAYQEAGQVDGLKGYQVVEAAHNIVLDAAVALGVVGLLLVFGMCVLVVRLLAMRVRSGEHSFLKTASVTAVLVGGFVALSFHYVTLDTAPLLSALLGVVASWELPASSDGAVEPRRAERMALRALSVSIIVVFAGTLLVSILFLTADRTVADARSAQQAGAPWEQVSVALDEAIRMVPFDPFAYRQKGAAAVTQLQSEWSGDALRDGLEAFGIARTVSPLDATLVAERANLLLVAAGRTGDSRLASEALRGFTEATMMDPSTGIAWAGMGSALAMLDRWEESVASLERSVELSPRYKQAWMSLATAYGQTGDLDKREEALNEAGEP